MSFESVNMGAALGAIGALGPASFALVDSLKILLNGGISNVGFASIERCVQAFFPNQTRGNATGGVKRLLDELHGNWISGRPLVDQKAMAKSLIGLRLTGDTAAQFAQATRHVAGCHRGIPGHSAGADLQGSCQRAGLLEDCPDAQGLTDVHVAYSKIIRGK
jgi:hypothetical protein